MNAKGGRRKWQKPHKCEADRLNLSGICPLNTERYKKEDKLFKASLFLYLSLRLFPVHPFPLFFTILISFILTTLNQTWSFLQLGASPHACGESDITPLFAALSLTLVGPRSATSIVRRLLDAGSDVNEPNKDGNSPLTFVCLQHRLNTELIGLLLQRGANVNAQVNSVYI